MGTGVAVKVNGPDSDFADFHVFPNCMDQGIHLIIVPVSPDRHEPTQFSAGNAAKTGLGVIKPPAKK